MDVRPALGYSDSVVALGADDDDERFEEQEGGAVAFLDEVSRQEQRAAQVATLSLTVWNDDCPLDDTLVGAANTVRRKFFSRRSAT